MYRTALKKAVRFGEILSQALPQSPATYAPEHSSCLGVSLQGPKQQRNATLKMRDKT
jgi:hypothetical protein